MGCLGWMLIFLGLVIGIGSLGLAWPLSVVLGVLGLVMVFAGHRDTTLRRLERRYIVDQLAKAKGEDRNA